ncbi:MAG: hypothetical protein KC940_15590 [Candidatus Omnitrophica bacterium]|nr:hypothetical protein [Candidatus Omnitrophota bacterium]MCA9431933.1 hypothetical protein [Candidatus Omnitrophota bacterium]MCA9443213.1 hypothetical protein [Candidatus Omnitrophota bacterium]MCB9770840.1 hypothetical protein [Candidatus Omnitrophota bacterium]
MSRQTILTEYWEFLKYQKKFWLVPVVAILVFMGVLLAFATSSTTIAPFIYPLL